MSPGRTTPTLPKIPKGLLKNKWFSGIASLVVGLLLGTTLGGNILESAGVPKSCVRAIQHADHALVAGKTAANDGKAALAAAKSVHVSEAVDNLRDAAKYARRLFDLAARFDAAHKRCNSDRK